MTNLTKWEAFNIKEQLDRFRLVLKGNVTCECYIRLSSGLLERTENVGNYQKQTELDKVYELLYLLRRHESFKIQGGPY